MKDKEKQIEEMAKDYYGYSIDLEDDCKFVAEEMYNKGYRKISENEVVIDKNENPCLSCPVPEDIQRDVDCSTICGAVRLGIDWQNQCKVLVKENKQLTKELAQARKETAERIYRMADEICTGSQNDGDKILAMIKDNFGLEIKENKND